jgi:hypothetical protein
LSFFHGTSDLSAAKIIREGAKCILDEMDVWNASKDIWSAILSHTNSKLWGTGQLFDDAGSKYANGRLSRRPSAKSPPAPSRQLSEAELKAAADWTTEQLAALASKGKAEPK